MNTPAWMRAAVCRSLSRSFYVLFLLAAIPARAAVPDRYGLADALEKRVDNDGKGPDARLYGVRNFRVVLSNLVYRGGANNVKNVAGSRDNRNPLQTNALRNLCEEGFGAAVYLYSTNYRPTTVECQRRDGSGPNRLEYLQISPVDDGVRKILTMVRDEIESPSPSPLYFHCWNGWHSSGIVAAYILRQFCGVGGTEAVRYWTAATDGNDRDPSFASLRERIRTFEPFADLRVSSETREALCVPLTRGR